MRVLIVLGILAVIVTSFYKTQQTQKQREAFGMPVLPGDIVWTLHKTVSTQALAVVVGIIAGILGLGGGELMAVLLLLPSPCPFYTSPHYANPYTVYQLLYQLSSYMGAYGAAAAAGQPINAPRGRVCS